MSTIKLRAATMTTRVSDGVPEALFEGGAGPVYLIGRKEIAATIKELIRFYKATSGVGASVRAGGIPPNEFMPLAEVMSYTMIKKSTIYRLMREGGFPLPVKLSPRRVAWRTPDIVAWMDKRPPAANGNGRW